MRGCLSVLAMAAVLVVAGVWFLGPSVAGTVVVAGLTAAGFSSTSRTVTVTADPPLELMLGRADTVAIEASGAEVAGLHAERFEVVLGRVGLFDRTYATVDGTMTGVTVASGGDDVLLSSITVAGPAQAAAATIRLPATEVGSLIRAGLAERLPIAPTRVVLSEPSLVTIEIAGQSLASRLGVDGEGRVVLEAGGGGLVSVVVFDPSGFPGLTIAKAAISGDEVVVEGTADVVRLIH